VKVYFVRACRGKLKCQVVTIFSLQFFYLYEFAIEEQRGRGEKACRLRKSYQIVSIRLQLIRTGWKGGGGCWGEIVFVHKWHGTLKNLNDQTRHKMHLSRILFHAYILRCYTVFRIIFLFYHIQLRIVLYIIVSYLNGDYSLCTGIISKSHELKNFLYFLIPAQKKATEIN